MKTKNIGKYLKMMICITAVLTLILFGQNVCAAEEELTLYARSAVLMDGTSGRILYAKEDEVELPMASTTKIMTCILALELADPDTVCTVSAKAASQPKVKLGMEKDDTFYLRNLLYSLMLESHNDTAVCIAEAVGGSVEGFASLMNKKAADIGCNHTYYITPNGLDAEDERGAHHTTARELALVMRYCLSISPKAAEFQKITGTGSYSFTNIKGNRSYSCNNHNTFLNMMDGALSGKTGFTGKAGYCYVGALKKGDHFLIVSLLACGWPNNRGYKWSDCKKLMRYGLEHYLLKNMFTEDVELSTIAVRSGQKKSAGLICERPERLDILVNDEDEFRRELELPECITAPVVRNDRVGEIRYYLNDELVAGYPVCVSETVLKADFLYCFKKIMFFFLSNQICM